MTLRPVHDPRAGVLEDRRPWGMFTQLTLNSPSTVKVIRIDPGQRLSLQRHEHRGEMWRILDGVVVVTVDDKTWDAVPDELIWIPTGAVHRASNLADVPARLLEVAFGDFDEDDIERLEDDYRR